MTDLIEFLRTRLDEDEQTARDALHADAVNPGVWTTEHHNSATHSEPNRCHIAEDRSGNYWSVAHEVFIPNAEHMARHDPARVLAEVDAKRRLVSMFAPKLGEDVEAELAKGNDLPWMGQQALAVLALPYSDHPDYREEWRP